MSTVSFHVTPFFSIAARFAYIEFQEKEAVENALLLHESKFKEREIKAQPSPLAVIVTTNYKSLFAGHSEAHKPTG